MPIRIKLDTEFFKKWNSDMAYTLGFFSADGNLVKTKRNTCFLSFYSADRGILSNIKKAMHSGHKLSKRNSRSGNVYRFQIGNKEIFNDLLLLGLSPNKSKRMKLPEIPKRYVADFIRGYFDGDGNVWSGFVNRHRKIPTRVLQVAFTSGSNLFLKGLHVLLKEKGIKGGSLYKLKSSNASRLMFSTLDALKLHKIMYNAPHWLCLERKKLLFEKFRNAVVA